MFRNLTDFGYQRNWKEAIGFYIAYFLLGALVGGLAGGLMGVIFPVADSTFSAGFASGVRAGTVISVIISLALSLAIIVKKKLAFGYFFMGLLAGLLALVAGGFLGLIPVAYLATRPSQAKTNSF